MGTLQDEPGPGLVYLHDNVSSEFNHLLANTKYADADTFVEHLFDLFISHDDQIRVIKLRADLARQFAALQAVTQFESSNGFMKHLMALHLQNLEKSAAIETPKKTQSKATTRKSRKSQPKRSLKHTVWVDSQIEAEDPSTEGDASLNSWREKSVSSGDDTEVTTDTNETSTAFDLSVVKQEVDNEEEKIKSVRDAGHETGPLCLTLHKPTSAQDPQGLQLLAQNQLKNKTKDIPQLIKYGNSDSANFETTIKNSRQFTQPNWRSSSEPVTKFADHVSPKQAALSLQVSPQGHISKPFTQMDTGEMITTGPSYPILGHMLDKRHNEISPNDISDRHGYNYVLNSYANDNQDSSMSGSLPPSPMHVPIKYPKSIQYTISSDEENEPEDLSFNSAELKPQNLSVSKNMQTIELGEKPEDVVKYDRNANAVTMVPITQLPNGQFVTQPPFTTPKNLIYHDPRSVPNGLIGQPQILSLPQNNSTVAQKGSIKATQSMPVNQSGVFVSAPGSAQPPRLQLVAVRGPPPLTSPVFVQQGMVSPASKITGGSPAQILVPVSIADGKVVVTSALNSGISISNGGEEKKETTEDEAAVQRKKRKRMEDTTSFRDPPEQSLPFNGPNKYRFYCDVCDTGFTRRYTFNRHKCKGRVEKHYCQLCDKAYLSKYKLKDHILVKHEGQTVNCPDCGKRFSSRSSMEMHKKQQHEGLFTIWCKICGKGFNHTGHYYGHMNKHTNTKPFWCQQCGKRFYGSSYLHNHKQVCRGNSDLNYACALCDRKFKCELYLKKHMKVHDATPIINDPAIAKIGDQDLSNVDDESVAISDNGPEMDTTVNGDAYGRPIFPNGPENSDSNSNSGMLIIDEAQVAQNNGSGIIGMVKTVTDAKKAGSDVTLESHQMSVTA